MPRWRKELLEARFLCRCHETVSPLGIAGIFLFDYLANMAGKTTFLSVRWYLSHVELLSC
jgi:hypothetical protein